MPSRSQKFPIGLDVGSRCIKLAQLRRDRNGALSAAAVFVECDPPLEDDFESRSEGLSDLISQALRAARFAGRNVVSCPPGRAIMFRNVRMPSRAGDDLAQAAHKQCGAYFDLPAGEYETRYFDAGEVWEGEERHREVIAMAARHSALENYLAVLRRCGLTPLALDAPPAAFARAVQPFIDNDPEDVGCALLDIGHATATLTIIHKGEVRFIRRLESGVTALEARLEAIREGHRPAQAALRPATAPAHGRSREPAAPQTTAAEAIEDLQEAAGRRLGRDLAKCVQYYCITFRRTRPARGLVTGAGVLHPPFLNAIRDATGIDFQPLDARVDLEWVPAIAEASSNAGPGCWALAVGLSIYGHAAAERRAAA